MGLSLRFKPSHHQVLIPPCLSQHSFLPMAPRELIYGQLTCAWTWVWALTPPPWGVLRLTDTSTMWGSSMRGTRWSLSQPSWRSAPTPTSPLRILHRSHQSWWCYSSSHTSSLSTVLLFFCCVASIALSKLIWKVQTIVSAWVHMLI